MLKPAFRRIRISRAAWTVLISAISAVAAACGSGSSEGPYSGPRSPEETLSILIMARDVEVGESRLPLVVMRSDENRTRLDDRLDDLAFAYRHNDDAEFSTVPDVAWYAWPVRGGAYTGMPVFDRTGVWEIQVTLTEDGNRRVGSSFIQVEQDSSAPSIGDPAPRAVTKTANTVEEVQQISSAFNPDPRFYAISLEDAITNGRPTVVLFSTPAFCVTQTCGPQLDTLGELMDEHGENADFIHVEIFDNIREMLDTGDSSIGEVAEPVEEWNLITEPWTFFIDSNGIVQARFEQFTTLTELREAMDSVLASG